MAFGSGTEPHLLHWQVDSLPLATSKAPSLPSYNELLSSFWETSLVAQKVKNLSARQETQVLFPESGRSPGEGNGHPLQFFLGMLEESSPSPAGNRPEGFIYGTFLSWIQLSVVCVE